ncbi:MAG: hypothetical protein AAF572_22305 [Cyanobacteria bacterium P01_B01_bin.77]
MTAPTLPVDLSITLPTGETIRHILLGSPNNQLILTPEQGDVISILMKRL